MWFSNLVILSLIVSVPHVSAADVSVRLVGGHTPYAGRLEIQKNGEAWGTVCDDGFDKKAASVVCKMLGLQHTENAVNVSAKTYGPGLGKVLLDEVRCIGNETGISQCSHDEWGTSNCDHNEDVGVNCQTPVRLHGGHNSHSGRVEVKANGVWKPLCYDVFNETVGRVVCRMLGYSTRNIDITSTVGSGTGILGRQFNCSGSEDDLSQCSLKEQPCNDNKAAAINCRTEVRLHGGPHDQAGRLEVFFQDKWGAVCDNGFNDLAASVVCRMLGYNPKYAKGYGRSHYGGAGIDILIDGLRCLGSETDIVECNANNWGSDNHCSHQETASVKCATEVRLTDGPTAFSGRLEIGYKGMWQTVCDKNFTENAAAVICKMLQFERGNVTIHRGSYYKTATGDIVDHSWKCQGDETDISDCTSITSAGNCDHNQDVGINCLSKTPVRLVGGPTPFSGRVEVYMQQEAVWKGVCNNTITVEDAAVLCTMLGKPNRNPHMHNATDFYDYVIRGKAVDHLNCDGSEKDITDCRSVQIWNNTSCTYPNYAGINCDPVTTIRLIDGPSIKAGRVEVWFNETWGSICDYRLSTKDTDIMCNMLGFNQSSYILKRNEYTSSDNMTINNLNCTGYESDISDCRATKWQTGVCSNGEAIGIACKSNIRLVNGSNERSGRVELLHNGSWGTICADTFNENVANVTCRMAGFRFWNASVIQHSLFGRGSSDVIIDNITCKGDEEDIAFCKSSPWRQTGCTSNQVATVHCKVQQTPVRLVNGETPYSGRVEVFHYNKWGTVCEKGFTRADAQVVCRHIVGSHSSTDLSVVVDKYDSGYKPYNVMIKNLTCAGNESDISLCPSNDWNSGYEGCPHSGSYQSVGVNCLTPVTLVGGRTPYMGRVEVTHSSQTGSICNQGFTDKNAKIICLMLGFNFINSHGVINETFQVSTLNSIMIKGLQCTGDEIDIQQCKSRPWGNTNCATNKSVSVNCNTPIRLIDGDNWRSGIAEVFVNGIWNSFCYNNKTTQDNGNAKVLCRMMGFSTSNVSISSERSAIKALVNMKCVGTEDDISLCNIQVNNCSTDKRLSITCDTGMKLVKGRTNFMGAVSVYLHGGYRIVQNIQNDVTASVVCSILGFNFSRHSEVQNQTEFRSTSCARTNMDRLICDGYETDVMDCKKSYWRSTVGGCSSSYNGVNCQTPVRLANGSMYQYGRVEIKRNGVWYPVCDKDFTQQDAFVVCRMLGHKHVK